jgi:hypothetical protein
MRTLHDDPHKDQAVSSQGFAGEIQPRPRAGVEMVRSADLGKRFFRGRRPASHALPAHGDVWKRRLARGVRRPGVLR